MYSSAELFSANERVILCVFAELQSYERNKQNQHSSEHRKKQFVTRVHTLFIYYTTYRIHKWR